MDNQQWYGERAWLLTTYAGDTKAGTLVGVDKFGNKFYQNDDELPRTYPITAATRASTIQFLRY